MRGRRTQARREAETRSGAQEEGEGVSSKDRRREWRVGTSEALRPAASTCTQRGNGNPPTPVNGDEESYAGGTESKANPRRNGKTLDEESGRWW